VMLSSFCLKIFLFVIEAGSYLNHCSNHFFLLCISQYVENVLLNDFLWISKSVL